MREVITYVAYDNTEFDNREECEAYEGEAFDLLTEVFNSYKFFVGNQEFLIFLNNIEAGLYALSKAFNKCDKILVTKPISDMALHFIDFQLGYVLPPNEHGMYKYDTDEFEWVKVGEQSTLIFC